MEWSVSGSSGRVGVDSLTGRYEPNHIQLTEMTSDVQRRESGLT